MILDVTIVTKEGIARDYICIIVLLMETIA